LDRLEVAECLPVEGCTDIPWPGLVLVDTSNQWYGSRSKPSYGVVATGKAYAYLDYICINGSGRVCRVDYPSDCCGIHNATLYLKKAGSIVAYSRFSLTVCSFG